MSESNSDAIDETEESNSIWVAFFVLFSYIKDQSLFLLVESLIKHKCKSYKQEYQQQSCEGGAVLVKLGDITDLYGLYFGGFYLNGVGASNLLFSPFCMPLLQIDRVGSYSDKYTVVEIDAVAPDLRSGVVDGAVGGGLDGLTGGQEHCAQ